MTTQANPNISAEDFEFVALSSAIKYRKSLIKEFSKSINGNVIEIGSGVGQMTDEIRKISGLSRLLCVEPDEAFCLKFRERLPGQTLIQGTIKDVRGQGWDSIVSINVLEHIEDDINELKIYHEALRQSNGRLNLFVPARPEIYSLIDKDFGHYRRYTRKDIKAKLENAGFKIEKIRYYNFVGYFAWWLNFCMLKKRIFEPAKVRFFDRFIFPAGHFIETRLFTPPVGQSLLIIARATPRHS